jgi:hypothetical protein
MHKDQTNIELTFSIIDIFTSAIKSCHIVVLELQTFLTGLHCSMADESKAGHKIVISYTVTFKS